MKFKNSFFVVIILSLPINGFPLPPSVADTNNQNVRIRDTDSYIDANRLLMFVTNKGSFAYDQGGILGKNDGLYFPYLGIENILNGTANNTVCFAAGIWIGGVDSASGDTLISVAEYSDDYFPGPMAGGTFVPNANIDPQYRVFKIFADSQSSNPNQDYLNWPSAQGAPVDGLGHPKLLGDQTMWSVYNDAHPPSHVSDASSNLGLGIEIQHTVWAGLGPSGTDTLPPPTTLAVGQFGASDIVVVVDIIDANAFTGHEYHVVTDNHPVLGPVWHLIDITQGDTVLANQTGFNQEYTITDGFAVKVSNGGGTFEAFEVVANANGPLVPPSGGALGFQNFPSLDPDNDQQVGDGLWAFHTGDNGGTSGGGTRGSYQSFLNRVLRGGNNNGALGRNDYEMRFTGSNSNPNVNGSYAIRGFQDDQVFWVPFELWRTGKGTPNDFTDDVRLTPWILDFGEDFTYNLESWGTALNGGGGFEHSASGGDNDPYTDWVYWYLPNDTSPGQSGYLADQAAMLAETYAFDGLEIMARTVLMNWNGGSQPPFNQDLPEQGTVFRIKTFKSVEIDSFKFTAVLPPVVTIGPEAASIYSKYKLINKSNNNYDNFFISLWFDADIGNAGDDFVGCDTLNDIFYSYNNGPDAAYGDQAPAVGGRLLEGPIVSSPGDIAFVDGAPVPNYKNLPMFSFMKYFNGTDPVSPTWTYQYMNGLDASQGGVPLPNGTRFAVPGDPVTGTGDLDFNSSDRRMMATFGPLNFSPNDTQQIVFKLAVGQGPDPLSSITELKQILSFVPSSPAEPLTFISPEPQRVVFINSLEPFYDSIFVGWSDGSSVLNIDGASLVVNDSNVPESATFLHSHPQHNGPVWKLKFNARQFLVPYGYIYDTVQEAFLVVGELTDGTPFSAVGGFAYIGHRRGDINRNGSIDVVDLTFMVSYFFRGGTAPSPTISGDANHDGRISILDLTRYVDIIFRGAL